MIVSDLALTRAGSGHRGFISQITSWVGTDMVPHFSPQPPNASWGVNGAQTNVPPGYRLDGTLDPAAGYGPNPVECVKLIRKNCRWSLCGNHDAALFMTHALGFNEGYSRGYPEWTALGGCSSQFGR